MLLRARWCRTGAVALGCLVGLGTVASSAQALSTRTTGRRYQDLIERCGPYCSLEGLSSRERLLLDDAADGSWNEHTLFEAALVASSVVDAATLDEHRHLLTGFAAELRATRIQEIDERQRAEQVLRFLHRRVLTASYQLNATELTRVLRTGEFNCVSATLLYICLAREAGLAVSAIEFPNHTRGHLHTAAGLVEVETTSADGFKLDNRPSTATAGQDEQDEQRTEQDRRAVNDVELIAMIYYNRGVDALRDHRYREAVTLNTIALTLDPAKAAAEGNLLAALNNLAVELCNSRDFEQAQAVIDRGLAIDPEHRPFHENRVFVYHRWLETLVAQREYAPAGAILLKARAQAPAKIWGKWAQRLDNLKPTATED